MRDRNFFFKIWALSFVYHVVFAFYFSVLAPSFLLLAVGFWCSVPANRSLHASQIPQTAGSHINHWHPNFLLQIPLAQYSLFLKVTIKQRDRTITMSTQHSSLNRQAHQLATQQSMKGVGESKNNGGSRRPFQPLSSNADRPTADKVSFRVQTHFRVSNVSTVYLKRYSEYTIRSPRLYWNVHWCCWIFRGTLCREAVPKNV